MKITFGLSGENGLSYHYIMIYFRRCPQVGVDIFGFGDVFKLNHFYYFLIALCQ